jgi:hypothetical protein
VFSNIRLAYLAFAATVGLASAPAAARAQRTRDLVIHVVVVDTATHGIAGVELSVVRGLNEQVTRGVTDATGSSDLRVPHDSGAYQVIGRRIGYQRAVHFFAKALGDTIGIRLEMRRAVQVLEAVAVTEKEDVARKSYHIDADEIANSSRTIIHVNDILTKLRPDMLDGRSGTCSLQNVWVNGQYIEFAPEDPHALLRRGVAPTPPASASRPILSGKGGTSPRGLRSTPAQRAAAVAWSVLWSIKPEHVDEINYVDCFRDPVHKRNSDNAVYVVLKPGIDFIAGIGSFVADTAWDRPRDVAPPPAVAARAPLPAYRNRLLGVYDMRTGDPLAGVEIIDVVTGTKAMTTVTGTVALGYLAEGSNKVRVHRDGYRDQEIEVAIGPTETLPVTVLLTPIP